MYLRLCQGHQDDYVISQRWPAAVQQLVIRTIVKVFCICATVSTTLRIFTESVSVCIPIRTNQQHFACCINIMFVRVVSSVLVLMFALAADANQKRAIVMLAGEPGVSGQITFTEGPDGLLVEGHVHGLTPGKHGFHVHALGDLSKGCASTGGHYNPHNLEHGAPEDAVRHAGDLGNIVADATGAATVRIVDKQIALSGEYCILGRAVVIHAGEDDLGRGGQKDSKTTGNAGGRVACGLIGVLN